MDTKMSYNYFLYTKRKELGLSRFKMARRLKMSHAHYCLLENGYIKASKKDIAKVSSLFEIDFTPYTEGENSYPQEIPEKDRNKITAFLYRMIGARWVKITLLVLTGLSLVSFVSGSICSEYYSTHYANYYPETVIQVRDGIIEKGGMGISIVGKMFYPEISYKEVDTENNTEKLVMISTTYETKKNFSLKLSETYWSDSYRFYFGFSRLDKENHSRYSVQILDRANSTTIDFSIVLETKIISSLLVDMSDNIKNELFYIIDNNNFNNDYSDLINTKLDMSIDYLNDVAIPIRDSNVSYHTISFVWNILTAIGLIFGSISLFGLIFAYVYGEKNKFSMKEFHHGDELFEFKRTKELTKKDMRFTPFMPETILELIGIFIVAIGSFRIILYSTSLYQYSSEDVALAGGDFLTIQMLGMILLYFIDFDLFMDDKRVIRNVTMYSILFIVIYYFEVIILTGLQDSTTIIWSALSSFMMPNPFGSVACYYMIMMFLFFTPNRIKTKKGLIIYRSMAAIPVVFLIVSFFIGHGDVLFHWDMSNLWLKYFFNGERLSFTLLAVGYLVGLFFIRLFFKKRYGEESANKFFMSNKFIMIKNIFTALIIIIVWIFELMFAGNTTLNKIGIGVNSTLIILVPLLLFYHPHKGPRSLPLDWTTLGLYFLSLAYAYVIGFFVVIVALAK